MKTSVLFCVAFLAACGGGGDPVVDNINTSTPLAQQQEVVVRYDINGDEDPDLVTLDSNGVIVAALESTGGDPVDTTDLRKGTRIDARVAEAIAAYVAGSVALASETRLDVVDSSGRTVEVTVFE